MSTTTTTPTILQTIEADLSADWQKVIAFFTAVEDSLQNFVVQVAQGGQVLETDITTALSNIGGKLSQLSGIAGVIESGISLLDPSASAIITEINTGITDIGEIVSGVASGAPPSGADAIVTDVVNAILKLFTLIGLANNLSTQITQAAVSSPSATQTTSPPTPPEG